MFDPRIALTELVASQRQNSGPKLSFHEKCAAFGALKSGLRTKIIMKAFGITSATASHLRAAEKGPRYADVASEFARLGDAEFMRVYYTDEIHTRLQRIKCEVEQPGDDRRVTGPNPNATAKSFADFHAFSTAGEYWRIDWIDDGWRFTHCQPNGEPVSPGYRYQGADIINPELPPTPFRTSNLAYRAVFEMTGAA